MVYFARRRHRHRRCRRLPPASASFAVDYLPCQPALPFRLPLSPASLSVDFLPPQPAFTIDYPPPRPAAAFLPRPVLPSTAFPARCDVDCLPVQLFTSISSPSMHATVAEWPPAPLQGVGVLDSTIAANYATLTASCTTASPVSFAFACSPGQLCRRLAPSLAGFACRFPPYPASFAIDCPPPGPAFPVDCLLSQISPSSFCLPGRACRSSASLPVQLCPPRLAVR